MSTADGLLLLPGSYSTLCWCTAAWHLLMHWCSGIDYHRFTALLSLKLGLSGQVSTQRSSKSTSRAKTAKPNARSSITLLPHTAALHCCSHTAAVSYCCLVLLAHTAALLCCSHTAGSYCWLVLLPYSVVVILLAHSAGSYCWLTLLAHTAGSYCWSQLGKAGHN